MVSPDLARFEQFTPAEVYRDLFKAISPFIGDRQDEKGQIPYTEEILDPTHKLFPVEIKAVINLLWHCDRYMQTRQEKELVRRAAALSLIAHQQQYRDSTDPYSTHAFWVANEMVERYQLDAVTVASALLHDTFEETELRSVIERSMPAEVVETVDALSKAKGGKQRKEIIVEENRLRVINSLLDNPRVAIIKIFDRLHNMKTLAFKKGGRVKRLSIIDETNQIYVPLAKRLGLFREAEELDEWCLRNLSKSHDAFAESIKVAVAEYSKRVSPESIIEEVPDIKRRIEDSSVKLHCRLPGVNDIYRRIGKIRKLTDSDFYFNIDAELLHFTAEFDKKNWVKEALSFINDLMLNGLAIEEKFDLAAFQQDLANNLIDSASVNFQRIRDGVRFRLNIFPKIFYDREQLPLTDMYYRRAPLKLEEEEKRLLSLSPSSSEFKRLAAIRKHEALKQLLNEIIRRYEPGKSLQFPRLLEPRLPQGFMRVVGVNEKKEAQPWPIAKGATVLDYAADIFTKSWPNVRVVYVRKNGDWTPVPFDYILSEREEIHIPPPKEEEEYSYDPVWIHCFRTNTEEPVRVRRKILGIVEREKEERIYEMKNRVIALGQRLINRLGSTYYEQPIRVGLHYAMDVIKKTYYQITSSEFLYKVGLGYVSGGLLEEVARALAETNRKVGSFSVIFKKDRAGLADAVFSIIASRGISMLGNESHSIDGGYSFIDFYLTPADTEQAEEIITAILSNKKCQQLELVGIDFATLDKHIQADVKK